MTTDPTTNYYFDEIQSEFGPNGTGPGGEVTKASVVATGLAASDISAASLVGGLVPVGQLPLATTTTIRPTAGIPAALTTDQTGDMAWDAVAQIMYGPFASGAWPTGVAVTPRASRVATLAGDSPQILGTGADAQRGLAVPAQGAVVTVSNDGNFNEQPSACQMSDGTVFVAHREVAAVTMTLSSGLATGTPITSLPITALSTSIPAGSIQLNSGTHWQTFVTTVGATAGATSITVTSLTPTFAFPTSSTVYYVGSDTNGIGFIGLRATSDLITYTPAKTSPPTNVASNATKDVRGCDLLALNDGRVLLTWTVTNAPPGTAADHSLTSGPGGVMGNIRGKLGTYVPSGIQGTPGTLTFGSEFVIPSGLTVSDLYGHGPAMEPAAGSVVWPVAGSNSSASLDTTWRVGYTVGTYTPFAGGTFTFTSTYVNIADTSQTGMTGLHFNEINIVVCGNGDWLTLWRESVNATTWRGRLVGGVGGLAGTGTWVNDTTPIISNVSACPAMLKTPSGKLVFVSRGSNTSSANYELVCYSNDNGLTWSGTTAGSSQIQPVDRRASVIGYNYGRCINLINYPGMIFWVGAMTYFVSTFSQTGSSLSPCLIESRVFSESAGLTPHGHMVANGLTSLDEFVYTPGVELTSASGTVILTAGGAATTIEGQNSTIPRNPGDFDLNMTPPTFGPGSKPVARLFNNNGVGWAGGQLWVPRKPVEWSAPITGTTGFAMSNMDRHEASNDLAVLVSGTIYCIGIVYTPLGLPLTHVRIWSGGTAGGTITHAWVALCSQPSTLTVTNVSADMTTALSGLSGSYSSGVWPANSDVKFTLATSVTPTTTSVHYVLLCVVGGTIPSITGKAQMAGLSGVAPALCGASATGQTTPPIVGATFAAPTGGIGLPYVQLET